MQESGYIYAMVNQSIEGLVKIGKTTREPETRAKELSQATGVATPFYVAFSIVVSDCNGAEEFVHAYLEQSGFRTSPSREFFQVPLKQAIEALLLTERHFSASSSDTTVDDFPPNESSVEAASGSSQNEHPGRASFQRAMDVYFGRGDELEDKEQGLRYLYQAKALSFPAAFTSLAQHFQKEAEALEAEALEGSRLGDTSATIRNFYRKAFDILKEGAEGGHGRCWIELADLYLHGKLSRDGKPDTTNAIKCWKRYFLSDTFHQNDDSKWTEDCEGVNGTGDSGFGRDFYMGAFFQRVWQGPLPPAPEILQMLRPFREELTSEIDRMIAWNEQRNDLERANRWREILATVDTNL
ncbi:MAG: hypothetical protein RL514_1747 [Verrucomicrobiota bacterium]|jgi:hypothetical protein